MVGALQVRVPAAGSRCALCDLQLQRADIPMILTASQHSSFSRAYIMGLPHLKGVSRAVGLHFEKAASLLNLQSRDEAGQGPWVCTLRLLWDHLGSCSKYF